jgi:AcrR family transcriptional regulator
MATARKTAPAARMGVRALSAQATRDKILKAATQVFAKHGYQGGSIEKISRAAKSVDRMIYYYFGSKEGLFIEVIEGIYRRMNEAEAQLTLNTGDPVTALGQVIDFVLGYYREHPEFITLLNTENLLQGRHIKQSPRAAQYSSPAIAVIADIVARGQAQGLFRPEVRARDVYLLIVSTGYFLMSNRYTLSAFLGERVDSGEHALAWKNFVTDAVLRTVLKSPQGDSHGHHHR